MNNLILELLNNNERVIIPDFGAFMKKKDTDVIYFNEYLKFNDGLLLDFLTEKENIEKPVAEQKIKDFVELINKQIETEKKFIFEGIGYIVKDEKGKLNFTQDTKATEKTTKKKAEKQKETKNRKKSEEPAKESKKEKTEKTEKKKDPKPVDNKKEKEVEKQTDKKKQDIVSTSKEKKENKKEVKEKTQKDEKKEPKPEKEEPKQKQEKKSEDKQKKTKKPVKDKKQKKSKWWLWLIIIIVLIIGGGYGFAFLKPDIACKFVKLPLIKCENKKKDNTTKTKNRNKPGHKTIQETTDTATTPEPDTLTNYGTDTTTIENIDSLSTTEIENTPQTEEIKEEDIIEEETTKQEENPVVEEPVVETFNASGKKYYVIAGCFENENNADKMVNKLRNEGYANAQKFGKIGRLHAVCYSYFDNKKDALNEIAKIGTEQAWLKYK